MAFVMLAAGSGFAQACNGKITIVKDVVAPDGSQVSDSHQFTVTLTKGTQVIGSKSLAEGANAVYSGLFEGSYVVTETADDDYVSDANLPITVEIKIGSEDKTVTLTNKQKPATITVKKAVVGADGITPVTDSHVFSVTLNGVTKTVSQGAEATFTVNPGTYSAVEASDPDYTLVSNSGPVTVAPNKAAEITLTNSQLKGTLTINKDVVGPSGEAAVDNHSFAIKLSDGQTGMVSENSPAVFTVNPGTFSVVETQDPAYGDISYSADAVIGSNGTGSITITNKQKPAPATLTLNKVVNCGVTASCVSNRCTAKAADWTLNAINSEASTVVTGTSGISGVLAAGTYTLTEVLNNTAIDAADYSPSQWACKVNGIDISPFGTDGVGDIVLKAGDAAVCTITNNWISVLPPAGKNTIKVVKYAIGGTGSETFTFTLDKGTKTVDITPSFVGNGKMAKGSGSFVDVTVGTHHIDETVPTGWRQLVNTCKNIKVRAGRQTTCVVVNKKIEKPCDHNKPNDPKKPCNCPNFDKGFKNGCPNGGNLGDRDNYGKRG